MVAAKVRRSVFAERLARKYFFSPELRCSPISQASSPGRCCWPLSLIRCGGPSAVRTRTAAKRALSLPFVPVRQLTVCHLAPAKRRCFPDERRQNGAIDHSRQVQAAPPSAEHSCDRQARSARPRKAGTFAASPCALTAPGTALATVQAQLPNPPECSSWSALQSRLPMSHRKTDLGIPRRSNLPK